MIINDVHRGITKRKNRKRIGRGPGSGQGKTAGKGDKGHSSRAGHKIRFAFEGGQMPMTRRIAKRGFSNKYFSKKVLIVNVSTLEAAFESGATVDPESMVAKGVAKGAYEFIKILGNGTLSKKLTVKAHEFSQSAVAKITASGGQVERIIGPC